MRCKYRAPTSRDPHSVANARNIAVSRGTCHPLSLTSFSDGHDFGTYASLLQEGVVQDYLH